MSMIITSCMILVIRSDGMMQAISGNLSFLNHLTILPCLACLDDACFRWLPGARYATAQVRCSKASRALRALVDLALLATVAYLSWPVAKNLLQLSGRQQMNASFGAFRLVNTYGAFGNVGTERYAARRALLFHAEDVGKEEFCHVPRS